MENIFYLKIAMGISYFLIGCLTSYVFWGIRTNKLAQRCPVCKGAGKLFAKDMSMDVPKKVCHGCNGKGWVVID